MAFTKRSSLVGDLKAALDYRHVNEDPEKFFGIMEKMVDKVWEHQFTNDNLLEQLLIHCSNEKDLKKELCHSKTTGTE